MSSRIAITGYSCLSPAGENIEKLIKCLDSRGNMPIEIDDSLYTSEVEGLNKGPYELHRVEKLCAVAVKRALSSSCIDLGNIDPSRMGIVLGNTYGAERFKGEFFEVIRNSEPSLTSPSLFPYTAANTLAAKLAILFGVKGRCLTFSSGITSSSEAVLNACDILQQNKAEAVAVVGESFYYDGFRDLFSAADFRNEYCACLILRREDDALKEGEPILAQIEQVEHGFDPEGAFTDEASEELVLNWGKALGDTSATNNNTAARMDAIFGNMFSASGVVGIIFSLHVMRKNNTEAVRFINRDSYGSFVSTLISDGKNGPNN